MTTEWTKGPWVLDETFRVLATDARQTIVHVPPGSHSNPECQADARLISAAPDLYPALEALLERHIEWLKEAGNDDHEIADDAYVVESRAALAKARGESP
jgi:hypothetical protein